MSKDISLVKNSIYNVAYKMLNMLFPFFTATYISHVLMAKGVGQVSYAQNIVSYFTIIAALGIPNYGTREVAKIRENKKNVNKLFTELFSINFVSTTVCMLAYYIMITSVSVFQQNSKLYMVVGLAIIFNYINVDWFYQGIEQYGYIAKRSFVIKLISLVCIFAFVRDEKDTVIYALIYCLGIGGNNLFNIINLKKYNVKFVLRDVRIKRHLKPIIILLVSVIAVELYTMVDTTMIGIFCSDENVGYYTNAMKLVKILISVVTAIGGVLLPRLSYYRMQGKNDECSKIVNKVFSIMMYIFVPCEIGILLVAGQVMPLFFGSSFEPAVLTLRLSSLLICTLGFSNLFGTQVLLTYGAEKKLVGCTIAGAVINICLNAILIPLFAQNGAAIASVISETVVTILAMFFSSKYIKIYLEKRFVISVVVSSIGLLITVSIIQVLINNSVIKLLLSIILGGAVYLGLSICSKNPVISELLALIKKEGKENV